MEEPPRVRSRRGTVRDGEGEGGQSEGITPEKKGDSQVSTTLNVKSESEDFCRETKNTQIKQRS